MSDVQAVLAVQEAWVQRGYAISVDDAEVALRNAERDGLGDLYQRLLLRGHRDPRRLSRMI